MDEFDIIKNLKEKSEVRDLNNKMENILRKLEKLELQGNKEKNKTNFIKVFII